MSYTYDRDAHTEKSPCMEEHIAVCRQRYNFGQTRDEMHDDLVPWHMTEEEFFLAYVAALVLSTDPYPSRSACAAVGVIDVYLGDEPERLTESWSDTMREFLVQEENAAEGELQVIGEVTAVSVKQGTMTLQTSRGSIRMSMPATYRREACDAMKEGTTVDVRVRAGLSSDGSIHHAKVRAFRKIAPARDYAATFAALWGAARDIFGGVPRDEYTGG